MADKNAPTENDFRTDYVRHHTRNFDSYQTGRTMASEQEFYGEQFDRFIAGVRAEAQSLAFNESRHNMQASLDEAMADVQADAWDQGLSAGGRFERDWQTAVRNGHPTPPTPSNPYRKKDQQ